MRPDRPRYRRALLVLLAAAPAALAQPEQADPALRAYQSANGMLARGMHELAAQEYRKFLSQNPTHDRAPHARYGLAVALHRHSKPEEALAQLEGLGELRGFDFAAESAFLQAQCELALSRPKDAAAPLQLILKRHASHDLADDAAALLTECLYRAGDHKAAIKAAGGFEQSHAGSALRDRAEYFAALSEVKTGDEGAAAARLARLADTWPNSQLAGQALLLSAQCAHRAGAAPDARRAYERVLQSGAAALHPDARLGLATLEHAAGKLDEAKKNLDELINEHANSPQATPARLLRARVLFDQGEYEDARAELARYAKLPGADSVQAAYWTAKCHLKSGNPTQAARLLASALENLPPDHPLHPTILFDLAAAEIDSGREEEAIAALSRFGREHADHALAPQALEALATVLHRTGDYQASEQICASFRERFPQHEANTRIDLLSAENAFLSDDLPQAQQSYERFLARHQDHASAALAAFRLGCIHFRRDNHAAAEPLLLQSAALADTNPLYRPAILYLGDIALRTERYANARDHFARYASLGDVPGIDEALLKQAIALAHLEEHEQAADAFEHVITEHSRSPHRVLAAFERSRSLLALGRAEEAERLLRALAESDDAEIAPLALTQLASLALARNDLAQAADLFRVAASENHAAAPGALHGLASVLLSSNDHKGALEALDQLIERFPDHPRLAEARAQRALASARLSPDETSLAEIDSILRSRDAIAPELRDALRYEQASTLRALERHEEARDTLHSLVQSASTPTLRIHAALDIARADLEANQPDQAAAALRSIEPLLSSEGVNPELRQHAQYQLAAAAFAQEDFKRAYSLFAAFLEAHPSSTLAPSASLLAAESLIRQNQHARAIEHLDRALGAHLPERDRQSALLRLGECHAAAQNWPESQRAFDTYLEQFSSGDLWFQARFGRGWALENQTQHEAAITEYAKVTAQHQGPTAARAQFQIGECLFAQGKHEDAVRELLKVDILYAYPEWSAAALYEAGRCFEALNQTEKAREQYALVRERHAQTHWASLAAKRLAVITN